MSTTVSVMQNTRFHEALFSEWLTVCADSSMYFDHAHLKTPSSKDDIITIVKEAVDGGRKVRVVGSGHSWSSVAMSDDVIVSLWNYTGIVSGSCVQRSLHSYPNL